MNTKIACGIFAAAAIMLAGCARPLTTYEHVYERYYATTIGLSTSADVLEILNNRGHELLSQSESVVAAWGKEGTRDRTHWFNMVAFDQNSAVAVRKYGFILEETAVGPNRQPRPGLRFDAELVLEPETLNEPYANANEMRVAVLRAIAAHFSRDSQEVRHDSATLRNSSAMVNQALNNALIKLVQSPAEAAQLGDPEGMLFDHMTLGQSHIRMLIQGDLVKLKIKAGKPWFNVPFEEHPDVIYM